MNWLKREPSESRKEFEVLAARLERSRGRRRAALVQLFDTLKEVVAVKMSPDGLAMLKEFEGCKLTAYRRPGRSADHWLWPYRDRHQR